MNKNVEEVEKEQTLNQIEPTEIELVNEIETDNTVEFYSDQKINENELEMILLYLENPRKSGGGDYIRYELDESKHILLIEYEKNGSKKRVLEKRHLTIKIGHDEFKLTANEKFNKLNFKKDSKQIILRNLNFHPDDEILQIYVENLVINDDPENDLEKITQSHLFENTFYIKYKKEFDLEKLKKRIEKSQL